MWLNLQNTDCCWKKHQSNEDKCLYAVKTASLTAFSASDVFFNILMPSCTYIEIWFSIIRLSNSSFLAYWTIYLLLPWTCSYVRVFSLHFGSHKIYFFDFITGILCRTIVYSTFHYHSGFKHVTFYAILTLHYKWHFNTWRITNFARVSILITVEIKFLTLKPKYLT